MALKKHLLNFSSLWMLAYNAFPANHYTIPLQGLDYVNLLPPFQNLK
jgi:hypothetical protein